MNQTRANQIILVAETGADLASVYVDQYNLQIVPMYVTMGDKIRKDGSFPVTDLYRYHETTGRLPKTSAPNPEDYREVFERIHALHPAARILHLCYSAVTSCSYQNALIAGDDMPFVTTLDAKSVTAGQSALVIRTARYLESHPLVTMEELVPLVQSWIAKSCMVFVPGHLEYLRAGGRVSNAAYLGASILSLKPLIEIKDGALVSTKKHRGNMEKVARKLIHEFFAQYEPVKEELYVIYSEGLDLALKERLDRELRSYGVPSPVWVRTGCVITTHCGPGSFGLAGFAGK